VEAIFTYGLPEVLTKRAVLSCVQQHFVHQLL